MKKIFILLFLTFHSLYAQTIKAYAIGIFDKNGNGENIQNKRTSTHNYNNTCFSKVAIFSKTKSITPKVNIGSSIGHFIKREPIYNKQGIKIGEELLYKHYNITKGYFEVRVNNRLVDSKVFIK